LKSAQLILELFFENQRKYDPQARPIQEINKSTAGTSDISEIGTINKNDDISLDIPIIISKINEGVIDEDICKVIEGVLDYTHLTLAFSDDITDVLIVFRHITERLGEIDFLLAIMFSAIYEDRLWIKYGFESLDSFLDNLPSVYRISRQTFINTSIAGKMIRYFATGLLTEQSLGLDFKLTPKLFHRNYSKIKLLYRIHFICELPITNEIMVNFRDMTYREFEIFVNKYIESNEKWIKHRYYHKSFLAKQNKELSKFLYGRPFRHNNLTEQNIELYIEAGKGRIVGFINSTNPVLVDSVIKYLQDAYKKDHDRLCQDTYSSNEIFYGDDQQDKPLSDVDWADFVPDNLILTIQNVVDINSDLRPDELRKAIIDKFKNKTELTIALALLIYLIEHNTKLHDSICEYFIKNKIERKSTLETDFAIFVLDLKLSRYKWLKRIGNSISYLKLLKNVVNFTNGNFLDKLSNLKTAFDNHPENPDNIDKAFGYLTAKRFRKFAYDKNDNLSIDVINRRDYLKIKPILNRLNICQVTGGAITVITLQSEKQRDWLKDINLAIAAKDIKIMENYPEINWNAEFQAEIEIAKIKEAAFAKYRHLGLEGLIKADAELYELKLKKYL
jgi:hypothetical protein